MSNQSFIKFGWQIGGGAGEQGWRRAAQEISGGERGGGEWRVRGNCIMQFPSIILISLPHFDF